MKTAENFVLVICGIFVTSVIAHLKDKSDEQRVVTLTGMEEYFKNRPRDCTDIDIKQGNGVFKIYPEGSADGFNVYCDMTTESVNGGWTVFQRRFNGKVNFERDWKEYREGFGSLHNEFWLGNDRLHILTSQGKFELMITLEDFSNQNRYAKYDNVKIGDEKSKYVLTYGTYRGDAGNSLSFHKGQKFSTKDRDNDSHSSNCATRFKGGWWYNACHYVNLNGLYLSGKHSSYANGINWKAWKGYHYSLKTTSMMIRRLK